MITSTEHLEALLAKIHTMHPPQVQTVRCRDFPRGRSIRALLELCRWTTTPPSFPDSVDQQLALTDPHKYVVHDGHIYDRPDTTLHFEVRVPSNDNDIHWANGQWHKGRRNYPRPCLKDPTSVAIDPNDHTRLTSLTSQLTFGEAYEKGYQLRSIRTDIKYDLALLRNADRIVLLPTRSTPFPPPKQTASTPIDTTYWEIVK